MHVSGIVDIRSSQTRHDTTLTVLSFPIFFVVKRGGNLDSSISGFLNGIKQQHGTPFAVSFTPW
jgi:hypothetical protein